MTDYGTVNCTRLIWAAYSGLIAGKITLRKSAVPPPVARQVYLSQLPPTASVSVAADCQVAPLSKLVWMVNGTTGTLGQKKTVMNALTRSGTCQTTSAVPVVVRVTRDVSPPKYRER